MEKPERNAPCWCGSGKKYKVCHAAFDDKLKKYEKEPYPIPSRDMIKNEEQIEGIRQSSRINIAVLDYVAEHIRMGMSTAEIDEMVYQKTTELGGIPAPDNCPGCNEGSSPATFLPAAWQEAIDKAIEEGDSLGAVVECEVPSIDPGYGEPFWDSVESQIAHAVFAIPGVRGIEFGDGFEAAGMKGSQHNDPIGPDGRPTKNGAGGANGGITNGAPIKFRVAFKPTSSIRKAQQTFNFQTGEMDTLEIPGRHDVCFALRTPVVVEAMTAVALADLVLLK